MASSGIEDLGNGAARSALIVQAKSVVVHSSNVRGSSNAERKRLQGGAGDPLSCPNVRVLYDQPYCVSGIPSQRAYPHVPKASTASAVKVSHIQSTSAYSLNGASNDLSKHSLLSRSLPHINASPAACYSHCQEPTTYTCQPHWNLDSLRLKSGLLGKRAFSPQRSICLACPSPPKSFSQRASVVIEKTMPTNQSLPWTSSKLRDNSNGVVRPPNAKMPLYSKQETGDLHSTATIVSGCKGTYLRGLKTVALKPTQPTVPLKDICADVLLNQCKVANDLRQFEKTVEEATKGNEHTMVKCVGHGTGEAPQRVSKISSEAEFTTAVQKLSKNKKYASHRTLNGLSKQPETNKKTLCRLGVPLCLSNEDKESCFAPMETNSAHNFGKMDNCPSTVVCDGETQGSDCAIPEVTGHSMASPQSPSVYTVTNQISAIHLTKEEYCQAPQVDPSLCPRRVEEKDPEDQREDMLLDGDEEELPDKLENDFSGDDDSDCDVSSTTSVAASSKDEELGSPLPQNFSLSFKSFC